MKNFAEVKFGKVINVLVAESEPVLEGSSFVEFSYDGSIRKNAAVIGGDYDVDNDVFISPKPYGSWILNQDTFQWESPIGNAPENGVYRWDEYSTSWVQLS